MVFFKTMIILPNYSCTCFKTRIWSSLTTIYFVKSLHFSIHATHSYYLLINLYSYTIHHAQQNSHWQGKSLCYCGAFDKRECHREREKYMRFWYVLHFANSLGSSESAHLFARAFVASIHNIRKIMPTFRPEIPMCGFTFACLISEFTNTVKPVLSGHFNIDRPSS